MIACCKTNDAFEDILTTGKRYPIVEIRNGSLQVVDDSGMPRWFGLSRFQLHAGQPEAVEDVTC